MFPQIPSTSLSVCIYPTWYCLTKKFFLLFSFIFILVISYFSTVVELRAEIYIKTYISSCSSCVGICEHGREIKGNLNECKMFILYSHKWILYCWIYLHFKLFKSNFICILYSLSLSLSLLPTRSKTTISIFSHTHFRVNVWWEMWS